MTAQSTAGTPSPWIARFLQPAKSGQTVLDVATGSGRHARLAHALGYAVTAIDRDLSRVAGLANTPNITLLQSDLEDGSPWPLAGQAFDAVIVTNYLHRPILPAIIAAVAPNGLLLYETFAQGNERYGKPSNPNFLLAPGELLDAVHGHLTPVAYEHVTLSSPPGSPTAIVQRIAAINPLSPSLRGEG
ncbi:MAG: class I SAM-dependent methyltransferase [Hyphomicrobiaceae bacterium]